MASGPSASESTGAASFVSDTDYACYGNRSTQMARESTDERKLREQGYIRIDRFCNAMDTWAQVCQKELSTDGEFQRRWREEFGMHWQFIRLAIAKSCLLDRLIYGGEQLRKEIC